MRELRSVDSASERRFLLSECGRRFGRRHTLGMIGIGMAFVVITTLAFGRHLASIVSADLVPLILVFASLPVTLLYQRLRMRRIMRDLLMELGRCYRCGYVLSDELRCPECGTARRS
jgi:hypothetical protein